MARQGQCANKSKKRPSRVTFDFRLGFSQLVAGVAFAFGSWVFTIMAVLAWTAGCRCFSPGQQSDLGPIGQSHSPWVRCDGLPDRAPG
jgi:hypothetical protein